MTLLCVGYLLLFAMSFGRGIVANGFFAVANESRGFIGPLTAMLYFVTAPADPKALRKYTLAYLYFGAALCIAAGLAAAGLPIGMNVDGVRLINWASTGDIFRQALRRPLQSAGFFLSRSSATNLLVSCAPSFPLPSCALRSISVTAQCG